MKLEDIIEYLHCFADTNPTKEDWEIVGYMVEAYLDKKDYHTDEYWLPEHNYDELDF